jgi:hypothetical protein
MDVEITLLNLTERAYEVQSVRLHLPESLKSIRSEFKPVVVDQLHEIKSGEERVYSKGVPRVTMSLSGNIFNTDTLLFVPGSYRLRVEIQLRESATDSYRALYAVHEVQLEPPLSAALRGGIIGAFLLALFVPAYYAFNATSGARSGVREAVKQSLVYFLAGSVVSITAILLLYRIGSANLPITIAVNDYLGGVIVGLFSYVFGNALYSQFFRKEGGGEGSQNG